MTDEVELITAGAGVGVIVTQMFFRKIPTTNVMLLRRPNRSLFFFLNAGLVDEGSVVSTLK